MYQESENNPAEKGITAEEPQPIPRTIFRTEAREHYIQNQKRVELPRLISEKLFRYLWIIALLLMAAGSLIAFWPLIQQMR